MSLRAIDDILQELNGLAEETSRKAYLVLREKQEKNLSGMLEAIEENPALLSDKVFDALEKAIASDPFHGLSENLRRTLTPVSHDAVHSLFRLACAVPQKADKAIECLEKVVENNQYFRSLALQHIVWLGQLHSAIVVDVLERQGRQNSDAGIRNEARHELFLLSRNCPEPEIVSRAVAANVQGTEDTDIMARSYAIGRLTLRVSSPSCPLDEVQRLVSVFQHVADDTRACIADESGIVMRHVAEGMDIATKRLAGGSAVPF